MNHIFEKAIIKKSSFIIQNKNHFSTQYKIDKKTTLGSGAYGKVYRVKHKVTGDIRACKTI